LVESDGRRFAAGGREVARYDLDFFYITPGARCQTEISRCPARPRPRRTAVPRSGPASGTRHRPVSWRGSPWSIGW